MTYTATEPQIINGVKHRHFESTAEYVLWLESHSKSDLINADCTDSFYRHERLDTSEYSHMIFAGIDMLKRGNEAGLDQTQAMVDKFTEELAVSSPVWVRDIAGYHPDVPAYLAGEPESMWNIDYIQSDRSPLRVWIGLTGTWSVSDDQLLERGIALAAFALALVNKRPVYITPYVNGHTYGDRGRSVQHSIVSWDIQTSPVVLSQLMANLSRPEISRYTGLPTTRLNDDRVPRSIPFGYLERKHIEHILAPDDLFIPPVKSSDLLLNNPIKWVKEQLVKYGVEDDE